MNIEPRPTWLERLRAIPRGVWGLGLILLALVTPLLVRTWFLSQVPDIGDPFDVAAFCQSMAVPPEQDVLKIHRVAARLYDDEYFARRTNSVPLTGTWRGSSPTWDVIESVGTQGWGAAEDFVKEWVAMHEPSLSEWKRATELNGIRFDATEGWHWWFDSAFNELFHEIDALACLRGRRCEAEHDYAAAFQWYRARLRFHRQYGFEYEAHFCESDMLELARWAALPEVTSEQLHGALTQLRRDWVSVKPVSVAIKIEYLRAMNSLRTRDGLTTAIRYSSGNQSPVNEREAREAVLWQLGHWVGGEPERTRRLYQHLVANQLRAIDLPVPTRPARHRPTSTLIYSDDPVVALPSGHLTAARLAEAIRMSAISHNLESAAMQWALLRNGDSHEWLEGSRATPGLVELALALQAYRRDHGTFPAKLEDLVPGDIDAVPVDPCDRKGLKIRYRLDSPVKALLWSVGGNGIDDNGISRQFDTILEVRAPADAGKDRTPESAKD